MAESLNLAYELFRGLLWNPLPDQGSANIPLFVDRTPAVLLINTAAAENRTIQQPDRAGLDLFVLGRTLTGACTLTVSGTYDGVNTTLLLNTTGQWLHFRSYLVTAGSGTTLDSYQWRLEAAGNASSNCNTFDVTWQQGIDAAPAAQAYTMFLANRRYRVKAVTAVQSGSNAITVNVTKDTGTGIPGSGSPTGIQQATISPTTANTVVSATLATTLSGLYMAAGDRLGVTFAGTVTGTTNLIVTVTLEPC